MENIWKAYSSLKSNSKSAHSKSSGNSQHKNESPRQKANPAEAEDESSCPEEEKQGHGEPKPLPYSKSNETWGTSKIEVSQMVKDLVKNIEKSGNGFTTYEQ